MNRLKEKNLPRSFYVLLGIVAVLLLLSLFSGFLVPHDPYETSGAILKAPSMEHLMGTDEHGRDVLSRVIIGSKTSIFSAFILIAMAGTFGTLIGLVGGYYGGKIDTILMRITDLFLAFPDMILAVAVAGILGGGLINAMLALFITTWTQYARLARSSTIAIKKEEFIQAARLSGCSELRILTVHVLPNIVGPLIVTATLHVSGMMIGIAGLSFLGLGVKVPEAEWGSMISVGRNYLQSAPWIALGPSVVMVSVMMVFNLLGDEIRDIFDPKSSSRKIEG